MLFQDENKRFIADGPLQLLGLFSATPCIIYSWLVLGGTRVQSNMFNTSSQSAVSVGLAYW